MNGSPFRCQMVTIITEIELLSFPGISAHEEQKIRSLLLLLDRIELTDVVRDKTIVLRCNFKLKLPDSIIAASALSQNLVLLTNDQGFLSVDGLLVQAQQLIN
jgi:predicted nucleic acid-binding protein